MDRELILRPVMRWNFFREISNLTWYTTRRFRVALTSNRKQSFCPFTKRHSLVARGQRVFLLFPFYSLFSHFFFHVNVQLFPTVAGRLFVHPFTGHFCRLALQWTGSRCNPATLADFGRFCTDLHMYTKCLEFNKEFESVEKFGKLIISLENSPAIMFVVRWVCISRYS